MLSDRLQNLETLLREMREENDKKINELKNELACERAAREKEVSSLTVRLSQAEESLSHQEEETSKIWEIQLKREQEVHEVQEEERQRKEEVEAHPFTVIKVSRDKDLWEQTGSDQTFDLVDHEHVRSFHLPNQMLFADFQREVEREVGVPVASQRFWLGLVCGAHAMDLRLLSQSFPTPFSPYPPVSSPSLTRLLFQNRPMVPLHERAKDDILLFLKFYNLVTETLRYVGRLFVKLGQTPADVRGKVNEICGLAPTDDILLFEEIKFELSVMCEALDRTVTFKGGQLEDAVCNAPTRSAERVWRLGLPGVVGVVVGVRSKEHTYDEVVARLAEELGLNDPSKIRLTTHNCYSEQPKPRPSNILYFETLDIPLPELQSLKTLRISFHNSKAEEVSVHNIRLPKKSTVADVLADLKSKVELSHPEVELRMLQLFNNKIFKTFPLTEQIECINDQVIHVYHFNRDVEEKNQALHTFGDPFFLVVGRTETVAELRRRIQAKLGVADKEFAEWRFAFVALGKPVYLHDSEVMATRF
ncbi:unnamed protein product [Closterium sp. NIES-65]|nr:unnamed protein product [Closterium sp. NIES-65]